MWAADNIAHANTLFYPLYYDIISLTSLKITQAFHLLVVFAENQVIFRDFTIRNSIRITEGSDNGDSDNRGPTVYTYTYMCICMYVCMYRIHMYVCMYVCMEYVCMYV